MSQIDTSMDQTQASWERRRAPRQRTFLRGRILYGHSGINADCAIKDLTADGARIQVHPDAMSADLLLLVVKDGVVHESETIWRKGQQAGLKFGKTIDLADDVSPQMKSVQRLWQELIPR